MELEEVPILRSEHQQDIEMPAVSAGSDVIPKRPKLSRKSVCAFSREENGPIESKERSRSVMKLSGLIIIYLVVMAVEIVGGFKANSLAVMTDAAHLLADVAGFSLSLFTVWASGWEATVEHSFGFARLEVLGALLSVLLIWQTSGILIKEAVDRIVHRTETINGKLMFAVAVFGFIVNLVMVTWLGHDHTHHACGHEDHYHHHHCHDGDDDGAKNEEEVTNLVSSCQAKTKIFNINIQGAYLHVMADLIQSVGVMIAGGILWTKPDWLVVDLICTLVFATFALFTTLPMLRKIYGILMDRTPSEINISRLESDLECIEGVQNIYDLHVWAITAGRFVLTCHIETEPGVCSSEMLSKIRDYCKKTHRIYHVTVQLE